MQFTQGKIDLTPEEAGYDSSRIEALHNHFIKLIDQNKIQAASYCISRKGKVFMHGALGPLTYKNDELPLLPTTIHHIASITKVFTAVAIMKLIEDGHALLDTPVGAILPQFNEPPLNKINLQHLLTHTSGMYPDEGFCENKYVKSPWSLIEQGMKEHKPENGEFDWIIHSLSNGLRTEPGEEWQYCSFGFCILGAVIEKLSGKHSHDYIMDEIVRPLGMNDTSFDMTPESAKRFIIRSERQEKYLNKIILGENKKSEEDSLWSKIPSTAGGLISTPYDLIRFANMMLGKGRFDGVRILGKKAVEKMTTPAIHNTPDYCWGAKEPDRGFGIGFDMRKGPAFTYSSGSYFHEGAGACALYIDPAEELAAAWFVPFSSDGWFAEALFNTVNVIWSGLM